MPRRYSIFTKPYRELTPDQLGKKVRSLGFDAVEFPLRPGYQLEPQHAEKGLPKLAHTLAQYGVAIASVASATDEACFAGCAAAGVKILRIMAMADAGKPYLMWEQDCKRYLSGLVPLCERYGVTVGVQNHFGRGASGTMELRRLVEDFDPLHIAAVWDAAHSGLAGEEAEQALDIIYDRMCLVNFKNAYYRRVNGPEADRALWQPYFTSGAHGQADYPRIVAYLKGRGYAGDICLPAEYTDEALVDVLAPADLRYVQSLMNG